MLVYRPRQAAARVRPDECMAKAGRAFAKHKKLVEPSAFNFWLRRVNPVAKTLDVILTHQKLAKYPEDVGLRSGPAIPGF